MSEIRSGFFWIEDDVRCRRPEDEKAEKAVDGESSQPAKAGDPEDA